MAADLPQILIGFAIFLACTPLLGGGMARVLLGERTPLSPVLVRLERGRYRLAGVDPRGKQHWTTYAVLDSLCPLRQINVRWCSSPRI